MSIPASVHALSVDFLEHWRPGGPWVLATAAPDKTYFKVRTFDGAQLDELRRWLGEQGDARRNVYFHVNPCTSARMDKKAEKTDVAAVEWLHVDVDPSVGFDFAEEQARLRSLIMRHPGLPEPSVVVFSGGGYQAFWRLEQPIPIGGDLARAEDAERYNLQIEMLLRGDSCHNVDRIMRLPGTVNWPSDKKRAKGQAPAVADLVLSNWDKRYPLSAFVQAPQRQTEERSGGTQTEVKVSGNVRRITNLDADLPKEVSQRCKVAIVQGQDPDQALTGDNSRSAWVFFVACELARAKVPDETIYAILTDPDLGISAHVREQGNSRAVHRCAVRTIQRAKEAVIDPLLELLNRQYSAVESVGGKFRIACESVDPTDGTRTIEFLLPDGFKTTWGNKYVEVVTEGPKGSVVKHVPAGKWWLEHPNRRTYRRVVFFPNADFPDVLNLWRGFAYDAMPGDCSLFLAHVRDIVCGGDAAAYQYLLGWMANAVQNPHLPGHTAVVLRGEQGTGKGTFAHHFGQLFGAHYKYVNNPSHVVGQFNALLRDACFVFADECFVTGNPAHEAALKALITEGRIRIEQKGVDNMEVRNCTHLLLATNATWAVSAALDDRRFFVLEVDGRAKCDADYFSRIEAQMRAGGYQALLHHLLAMDLSKFNVRARPKTEELRHQQEQSLRPMEAFWLSRLEDGKLCGWHRGWTSEAMKDQLADAYVEECDDRRALGKVKMSLGRWLKAHARAIDHQRTGQRTFKNNRGRDVVLQDPMVWRFPPLRECRRLWDDKFGVRQWPAEQDVTPSENPGETDAF